MSEQNNLIVYCEFEHGKVADVSLELLTKGRSLATQLGVKLQAIVAGDKLEGIENQLFPYGVDTVYKAEDARLYPYTSLPHSSLLLQNLGTLQALNVHPHQDVFLMPHVLLLQLRQLVVN